MQAYWGPTHGRENIMLSTLSSHLVLLVTGSNIAEPAKLSAKIFQNSETAFSRLTELNKIGGIKNAGVVGG
jgi:hypothetical protein